MEEKTLDSDFPPWLFIELTFKVSMLPRHGALAYKLTSLLTILLKTIWFPIKLKYDAGLLAGAGPAQGGGLSLKLFICISAGARRRQSPAGTPLSSSGWYLAFHGTSPAQPSPAQETHLNTTVCNWYQSQGDRDYRIHWLLAFRHMCLTSFLAVVKQLWLYHSCIYWKTLCIFSFQIVGFDTKVKKRAKMCFF